jgi:hypothetical protein
MFREADGYVMEEPIQPPPPTGQTGSPSQTASRVAIPLRPPFLLKLLRTKWMIGKKPLIEYLQDPKGTSDRKVRRWTLKFILDNDELYRQTADDLFLKCLGPDQARLAMAEVHDGVCGTHQSTPKMKLLLRRGCFYCPTMIVDSFRYYKGCEECRKHGDV